MSASFTLSMRAMTRFEAAGLLNEIVAFAQEIICRPLGDLTARREHCEALQAGSRRQSPSGRAMAIFSITARQRCSMPSVARYFAAAFTTKPAPRFGKA